MKIGIFDSGLGGLGVGLRIMDVLPQYDYVYLGDTLRVPYGNRSQESIYRFTEEAVEYLFRQDCALIVLACNTASAEALRKIQQQYLPEHYPDRRVLGVLIPAAEKAAEDGKRIGVLATSSAVRSGAFPREIHRIAADREVFQQAAPLLVPMVENNGLQWVDPILAEYVRPLTDQGVDTIILGCTHYIFLRDKTQELAPHCRIVSPEELLPPSLASYLERHPEIRRRLSEGGTRQFLLTDVTPEYEKLAERLTGKQITFQRVEI
jgi:glutamate racemase